MHSSSPKKQVSLGMSGFYKIEAINVDTNEKRLVADWFPNLITNIGLNTMGTLGTTLKCMVGTNNTAPNVSNTTLLNQIAATTNNTTQSSYAASSAPYFGAFLKTFRFAAGEAAGNLSEVGIGWEDGGTDYCFSRALILDSGGSPTTITILSNEILDVTYELRCYAPDSDQVFNLTLSGVTYTCTLRAAIVTQASAWAPQNSSPVSFPWWAGAFDGTIGDVTESPNGDLNYGATNYVAYSNNSLQQRAYGLFELEQANFATGIKSIHFSSQGHGAYQVEFSPAIPKDNTKTFRYDYGVTWARR